MSVLTETAKKQARFTVYYELFALFQNAFIQIA